MVGPPLEIFPEPINGREVLLVGVDHHPTYFHERRTEFEDLVRGSGLIVLEHFPLEGARLDRNDPLASADQTFVFYRLLLELAGADGKQVAVVDPDVGTGVHLLDWALAGAGMAAGLKALVDAGTYLTRRRRVSRRRLLATSVGAVAAYGLAERNLNLMPLKEVEALARGPEAVLRDLGEYGPDDVLAYELLNYRDVCAAVGLDLLAGDASARDGPITVFYGRLHPRPILAYLRHPAVERRIKLGLYLPFGRLGDQALRLYELRGGEWVLTRRQPY